MRWKRINKNALKLKPNTQNRTKPITVYEVVGWRAKLLKKMGFIGFTWINGSVWILADLPPERKEQVKLHENKHLLQMKQDGKFKFLAKYCYFAIKYGYHKNPYEIEARRYANEIIS